MRLFCLLLIFFSSCAQSKKHFSSEINTPNVETVSSGEIFNFAKVFLVSKETGREFVPPAKVAFDGRKGFDFNIKISLTESCPSRDDLGFKLRGDVLSVHGVDGSEDIKMEDGKMVEINLENFDGGCEDVFFYVYVSKSPTIFSAEIDKI